MKLATHERYTVYKLTTPQANGSYTSLYSAVNTLSEMIKVFDCDPEECEIYEITTDEFGNLLHEWRVF